MNAQPKRSSKRAGGDQPLARPRGRPRSAEADSAIFGAVFQLLPEHGLSGLTMESVAKLAGVSKATIYRRWPSKEDLVMDFLTAVRPPPLEVEDTGSLVGDLDALNARQVEFLGDTKIPRLMPRLLSEAADDPRFLDLARERLAEPVRETLKLLLQRAIDRGELRADIDLDATANLIHASAVYALLMNGGDMRALPDTGRPLVAALKDGIGASSSSAGRASARPRS